jgi:predicted glycoside hydrolase/deacetylase ChbG (UPF0249 family)
MSDAVNAAIVESLEHGIASSCSLMAPCPAAQGALRLLRARPHIPEDLRLPDPAGIVLPTEELKEFMP